MEKDKGRDCYRGQVPLQTPVYHGPFITGQQLLLAILFPYLSVSHQSEQRPEPRVSGDKGAYQKNSSSKNMLMMLSTLPVLQFDSIICTFSPDFHDFRTLFIKYSIINQAPSLSLMRLYLQHPSPMLFSTRNPDSYYI